MGDTDTLQKTGLAEIPIGKIRPNKVSLRKVNRESEQYLGLVDSMKAQGFFGAITVRLRIDEDSGEEFYELIDGLHRYTAALDAGLEKIKVDIQDLGNDQVLEAQILANIHKIETKHHEYSKQLRRILDRNPMMTEPELAQKLGKTPQWIRQRLDLNKIDNPKIIQLINEGKMRLANAYALSKLPADEQLNFVEAACSEQPDEFIPKVTARKKELNEQRRQGKGDEQKPWSPVAFLQKMTDIKSEVGYPESSALTGVACNSIVTPDMTGEQGFVAGLNWALHLDDASVKAQKTKEEERRAKRDDARKKKAGERATSKAAKAIRQAKIADFEARVADRINSEEMTEGQAESERKEFMAALDREAKEAAAAAEAAV